MHQSDSSIPLEVSKSGVLVVDGYGIKLRVERGHLVVSDGSGAYRREGRFARATAGLSRLVLLAHTGFATLDAIRWLADVGIGWVHLDPDGRVLATSSSLGLDDPRLRRAQATAWGTATGLAIARDLLRSKLRGQAEVAGLRANETTAAATIEQLVPQLDGCSSPAQLMVVEAAAANAYWAAWAGVPLPWIRGDVGRVPEHWRTFGGRASPLTGNSRLAANPANAMLNWIYGAVEAEARLACLGTGLDPGLGVLHADQKSRDSLALDVMEAVRPEVDAYVLDMLTDGAFRADDFHEMRQGQVRVLPPLTHRLAETAPIWRRRLAPVAERVAAAFVDDASSKGLRLPTPLTEGHRSRGRDTVRRHSPTNAPQAEPPRLQVCRACGVDVSGGQRWCDGCRPGVMLAGAQQALATARATRARMHEQGLDPSTSEGAKAKNRAARLLRRAEERIWDKSHPGRPDIEEFRTAILPTIRCVPVRQLASATGLSVTHCAYIRKGLRTPHARWWETLKGVPLLRQEPSDT